jgi:putative transposase
VKFAFIEENRNSFDICGMCSVLEVTKSGFYAWRKRPASKPEVRSGELGEQIRIIHQESDGIYGSIKIARELRHRKIKANHKTVAALMRNMGTRSKVCKKFRVQTTDANHSNLVAPNTLDRQFRSATAPNQIRGTDIAYIQTDEGFV